MTCMWIGGAANAAPPVELLRAVGLAPVANANTAMVQTQLNLAWVGLYDGPLDGTQNAATGNAVLTFQTGLGIAPTGILSGEARQILATRANNTRTGFRFTTQNVPWFGSTIRIPSSIIESGKLYPESPHALHFEPSHHSGLTVVLSAQSGNNRNSDAVMRAYQELFLKRNEKGNLGASISTLRGFAFSAKSEFEHRITLAQFDLGHWRVVQMRFRRGKGPDYLESLRPVAAEILQNLDLFAEPGLSFSERQSRAAQGDNPVGEIVPKWFKTMSGNGSGSIVSRDGHILTNWHVVDGCVRLTVNGNAAQLVGADVRLDLALLRSDTFRDRRHIRFRAGNPRLGEGIAIMGYPLFPSAQALNYTTGTVSSTVGLNGDRTRVQVTAPIQPGNSGGPVLDSDGRQVAVVVAKSSTNWQAEDNVENVGWVVRGQNAISFLQRFDVPSIVETEPASETAPSSRDVDSWRSNVVRIECHQR